MTSSNFKSDSFGPFLRQMNQYESEESETPPSSEPINDLLLLLYYQSGSAPLDDLRRESEKSLLEFSRELTALKDKGLISITGEPQELICELTEAGSALF